MLDMDEVRSLDINEIRGLPYGESQEILEPVALLKELIPSYAEEIDDRERMRPGGAWLTRFEVEGIGELYEMTIKRGERQAASVFFRYGSDGRPSVCGVSLVDSALEHFSFTEGQIFLIDSGAPKALVLSLLLERPHQNITDGLSLNIPYMFDGDQKFQLGKLSLVSQAESCDLHIEDNLVLLSQNYSLVIPQSLTLEELALNLLAPFEEYTDITNLFLNYIGMEVRVRV